MLFRRQEEILRCSFCSKAQDQVDTLIANPAEGSGRVYICNECVEVCNAVLEEHQKAKPATAGRFFACQFAAGDPAEMVLDNSALSVRLICAA